MVKNSNYTFSVSVSTDRYINKEISGAMIGSSKVKENRDIRKKYGYASNKGIGYKESIETPASLKEKLINGSVMCHLFNPKSIRKDGTFGSSEKRDDNFRGSYCVGVDIDETSYTDLKDFIDKLTWKPTFCYTSYSNKVNGKGLRFRMIYVFDTFLPNKYFFRYVAWTIHRQIEVDTNEKIKDDCGIRCSQYFNGTNITTPGLVVEGGITNNIYSLEDWGITEEGFKDFLGNNCYYKKPSKSIRSNCQSLLYMLNKRNEPTQIITTTLFVEDEEEEDEDEEITTTTVEEIFTEKQEVKVSKDLIHDMTYLTYDEFMKYNRHKYNYFYRTEKSEWINDSWQKIDEDYFSLYYNATIVKDGTMRRKKLYNRMCLRRIMNPDVNADTLLFNAYEDVARYFEVDKDLTIDCLVKNVKWAMEKDLEELREEFSESIEYLKKNNPKRGIIYKNRKAHSVETTYLILDEYYDQSLTVQENLKNINDNLGYVVGKSTIYNFLESRNMKTSDKKLTDDEIISMIDWNLPASKNLEIFKSEGIKIGNKRLNKIYKEHKD